MSARKTEQRNHIDELLRQGYNQNEIARIIGISSQRIHQIVSNYGKTGRQYREAKYRNMGLCEGCQNEKAVILHHKDFNNANDDIANLEKLCLKCHHSRHKGRGKSKTRGNRNVRLYLEYVETGLTHKQLGQK